MKQPNHAGAGADASIDAPFLSSSTFSDDQENNRQRRTERPSDLEHAKILMKKNFFVDRSQKRLFFARTFIGPAMLLLWTFGFFFNYPSGQSTDVNTGDAFRTGDYVIYPGEEWTYPSAITLASTAETSDDFLPAIRSSLQKLVPSMEILNMTSANGTNSDCETVLTSSRSESLCISMHSILSYQIVFDGMPNTQLTPSHPFIAGAQRAMNMAILNASGVEGSYNADTIQKLPEKASQQGGQAAQTSLLITSGILLSLAFAMGGIFVIGPLVNEQKNFVVDSLLLVGVKRTTYMLASAAYYSLSSGSITAIALTIISIFWRLYPMSNGGLIFLSHYLAILEFNLMVSFVSQVVKQEELATGMPWLLAFASMAISVPFILFDAVKWILFIFSAISPYVAVITYSSIYANYDIWGFNTGVHPGLNVSSSGILSVTIAQIVGCILWVLVISAYCRIRAGRPKKQEHTEAVSPGGMNNRDAFEELPLDADVVLSIRDLVHSYPGGGCIRKAKPTEVLKGFSMDLCRGECFGFLGHNGAGKTTTIKIATGELHLQNGQVVYNFSDGPVDISRNVSDVRANIGVCPQSNVILGKFTARETLRLFASLKGRIPLEEGQSKDDAINAEVERRIADLQFEEGIVDKPVETLSGGMKRKVAIATALLGDPECILLDEPSAGCDPYSRRQIWDLIIRAKAGRCLLLVSHFLDEVDVLSDRVGIISDGRMLTCGSSLFLKHHFGVGYSLSFRSSLPINIKVIVDKANDSTASNDRESGTFRWELPHGSEPLIPSVLRMLEKANCTDVSLDLTTLEQVFLATENEVLEQSAASADVDNEDDDVNSRLNSSEFAEEDIITREEHICRIWDDSVNNNRAPLSFRHKLFLVQKFLIGNAFKMKGAVFLNIIQPLIYLVAMMVVVSVVGVPEESRTTRVPDAIHVRPSIVGPNEVAFFGLSNASELPGFSAPPLVLTEAPTSIDSFLVEAAMPTAGGFWDTNSTLQYNSTLSRFALQAGEALLANYSMLVQGKGDGISTTIQQVPYTEFNNFRIDLLLAPMGIAFGFMGLAYCVLDALLLKSKNNFELFRVVGVTEWTTNLAIVAYKTSTAFVPFFLVVIALGLGLKSMLFGNSGRWLGTILILLSYAFSIAPLGLLFATMLTDYKSVSQWFPGVFMTLMSLPYTAWVLVLQLVPSAVDIILIVGDVLCIIPPFAFQRGLGAVLYVSSTFSDENLSWGDVWSWESRVWFTILLMAVVGGIEWVVLYRRTVRRSRATKLVPEDRHEAAPKDVKGNDEVEAERERSLGSDSGIRSRDLVKTFYLPPRKKGEQKKIKKAVGGISLGIDAGEKFCLVGPNGAGKSVTLSMISGELRPDHGEIALDGEVASSTEDDINHLYSRSNISYAPQFDSLFDKKTVAEHLKFYAQVRGLDVTDEATQDHITSIVEVIGLKEHLMKESTALSGGFKRRLSLAISLLGRPTCLMMDEITTGMSPDARHDVWDILQYKAADTSTMPSILLSTHYIDEASSLGDRIGIMIGGELSVVGSLGELQDKYCHSYFVEIALGNEAPPSAQEDVVAALQSVGLSAEIYESSHLLRFKMKVPFLDADSRTRMIQLADMFELLFSRKEELSIKFYSIAQMTLEQIFIDLCRGQFEADLA